MKGQLSQSFKRKWHDVFISSCHDHYKGRVGMIKFENVTKVYKGKSQTVQALDNVNLTINKGDIFGVIGHSGAGKSTLIRTVNLLERPSSGQVLVQGKNLAKL